MKEMLEILQIYFPICAAIISLLSAQILKLIIFLLKKEKIKLNMLLQAGGMPSTHAASVIGITTALAIKDGFQSHSFMIAIIFSFIVLYDASGVRYTVGQHGKILNKLTKNSHQLNELLGHTPLEVAIGSIIGILIPIGLSMLLLSP